MDCSKFMELFNPASVKDRIHIIGCGSVGSTIAELLARYGLKMFDLYDFDVVEAKNIANQMYRHKDIGRLKVEALKDLISEINPEAKSEIVIHSEGYTDQPLSGYVFLAVDDIELRKRICEEQQYNPFIRTVVDVRTGLYDAETRAARWSSFTDRKTLIDSMNFTNEQAKAATPVSACGVEFGVAPTVRMVCTLAVTNFMNYLLGNDLSRLILVNPFDFEHDNTVMVVK